MAAQMPQDLVTDQRYTTRNVASLQVGSFGTYRGTADVRYRHDASGFVVGVSAFGDHALNNYRIDVEVPDARGRLGPASVRRFHDRYVARGAAVEVGLVNRAWARRLLLRGFLTAYDKELQNNTIMTVPYGEVTSGETAYGATLRYDHTFAGVELEAVANYARRTIEFVDRNRWIYDWYGRRVGERRTAGEIDSTARDQLNWQDAMLMRVVAKRNLGRGHAIRASLAPTYTTRTGDERVQSDPTARDPLSATRDLFTLVSGLSHELSAFDDRLENIAFVKDYVYRAATEEALPGRVFRPIDRDTHRLGAGDALRYRIGQSVYLKASYEFATRLPRPDEVFGNGILIAPNLRLDPEQSHNGNFGPRVELRRTRFGDVTVDLNAFLRDTDRQIVLLGSDRFFSYQNVFRARSLGIENAAAWSSPGRRVMLDGTITYQDLRNTSSEGTFGDFEGDRIPNRPYLFASWGARVRFNRVLTGTDTLEPFYVGRYSHAFFRGWESQGIRESKQEVPSQLTHGLGLSYRVNTETTRVASTFEVQNVTDARVYDLFGVQRPGRAFFIKLTVEL